eukprot:5001703-Pyramimonas_sp.AAC.1
MGPFACTYDPTNPKVRALDISDAEKALKFGETVVKVILAPMLKIGQSGAQQVINLCKRHPDRLAEHARRWRGRDIGQR